MGLIYIMLNFPILWKCKIGISTAGKLHNRRRCVSGTTPGFVFPVWVMVLPFGTSRLEADIHRLFQVLHCPFGGKASGRTEWFYIPVAPLAWLLINFTAALYWSPFVAVGWWLITK